MHLRQPDYLAFRVTEIKSLVGFYTKTFGFRDVQEMEMDFGETKALSNVLNLPQTEGL